MQFNYKKHLSPYLQYKWKFNDFWVCDFNSVSDTSFIVHFKPSYRSLLPITEFIYNKKKGFAVSAIVSTRLAYIASIIAVGKLLNKPKKDGEVITSEFQMNCDKPIFYKSSSVIKVSIDIEILKQTDKYDLLECKFKIGGDSQHHGMTKLYYCKPNLKEFSYL